MKLIALTVIVGIIALVALIIYVINAGIVSLRKEVADLKRENSTMRLQLQAARHGLFEIAGGQSGNPVATAMSTIDRVETEFSPEKRNA